MSGSNSLINLGDLSKPATVLIERCSDAVGGLLKPWQTKRQAKAEAEADVETAKIRALGTIEVSDIQRRGLERNIKEQGLHQANMERITAIAAGSLSEEAKPEEVEEDWLSHFFQKARIVSDQEMQSLWAKMLAQEAEEPRSFSKKTLSIVSDIEKKDAEIFTNFCSYVFTVELDKNYYYPFILDPRDSIYDIREIKGNELEHLESIGLIANSLVAERAIIIDKESFNVAYFGEKVRLNMPKNRDGVFHLGMCMLTMFGEELVPISGAEPVEGFFLYMLDKWTKGNYQPFCPMS